MFSISGYFGVGNTQNIGALNKVKNSSVNFRGIKQLDNDTNDFTSNVRKTKIKDMSGNDVNATIVKNENDRVFFIYANGERLGYAHYDTCNCVDTKKFYLSTLSTQEHLARSYKCAGTELIRSVVNESINEGFKGEVNVTAVHGPISPMVFYYKNNFVSYDDKINAYLHYAAKNNVLVKEDKFFNQNMKLDENGAKAFLEGKRLYETRTFEKIGEETINGKTCSLNLIQSPKENMYSLLMVNENNKREVCYVNLEEKKDINGKKHYSICDIDCYDDKYLDCAINTLENAAKTKGYDRITVQNKRLLREYPTLELKKE